MGRYAHDRPFAVAHEYIIAHPNRYRRRGQRMAHEKTGWHTALFLRGQLSLHRRPAFAFLDERGERDIAFRGMNAERMFGRDRAKSHAHDGVGARRERVHDACAAHLVRESHPHALAPAHPVHLHGANPVRPAGHVVESIQQIFGVGRDLQVVHRNLALLDDRAGAPSAAVDDLLVRQYGLVDGVPVHDAGLLVGDASFHHSQEQPLVPAVIFRIAGREFTTPIESDAQ